MAIRYRSAIGRAPAYNLESFPSMPHRKERSLTMLVHTEGKDEKDMKENIALSPNLPLWFGWVI